jgi:hypothetical protein
MTASSRDRWPWAFRRLRWIGQSDIERCDLRDGKDEVVVPFEELPALLVHPRLPGKRLSDVGAGHPFGRSHLAIDRILHLLWPVANEPCNPWVVRGEPEGWKAWSTPVKSGSASSTLHPRPSNRRSSFAARSGSAQRGEWAACRRLSAARRLHSEVSQSNRDNSWVGD